jgi:antirestriction protein ArdC
MPNSRMADTRKPVSQRRPCGIIRIAALWPLCRYRHNGHWTRHESRLDRSFGREKWGDEGYAREELCAELGAAFLAADLGIALEPRPDHASYIASWIKVLQNDTRAIVQAAAHAERAVAFLHQLANPEAIKEAA